MKAAAVAKGAGAFKMRGWVAIRRNPLMAGSHRAFLQARPPANDRSVRARVHFHQGVEEDVYIEQFHLISGSRVFCGLVFRNRCYRLAVTEPFHKVQQRVVAHEGMLS